MIKLSFSLNKEVMNFRIDNKKIYYSDRLWKDEIRVVPKDEQFISKVLKNRNKFNTKIINSFNLNERQQKEYDECKDEEEVAVVIIKDMSRKGGKLLKRENA